MAEVWYRVVRLPYSGFQVVAINDTERFERLAGLGVVMVVSERHRQGVEKGMRCLIVEVNGETMVCCVWVWCGRLVSLGALRRQRTGC